MSLNWPFCQKTKILGLTFLPFLKQQSKIHQIFCIETSCEGLVYRKNNKRSPTNSVIGRCTPKIPRFFAFFPFFKSGLVKFKTDLVQNLYTNLLLHAEYENRRGRPAHVYEISRSETYPSENLKFQCKISNSQQKQPEIRNPGEILIRMDISRQQFRPQHGRHVNPSSKKKFVTFLFSQNRSPCRIIVISVNRPSLFIGKKWRLLKFVSCKIRFLQICHTIERQHLIRVWTGETPRLIN
jgi:hypothetical protein